MWGLTEHFGPGEQQHEHEPGGGKEGSCKVKAKYKDKD